MKIITTIAWIWVVALLVCVLAVLTGCSSPARVVRASIRIQCGTNIVTVEQPKDTIIERMEFDPKAGQLKLYGYQSTANAAAVEASRAQATAQADVTKFGLSVIQALAERAAESQGVPRGYKIVPQDDPSHSRAEIEPKP